MEFTIREVVPESVSRSAMGRVVIDPPNVRGPLATRVTGAILMCCNRAFLTEAAYKKHAIEKKEHGKAIDFSKLPPPKFEETKKVVQRFDTANRNLWIVRKEGCAIESNENENPSPGEKPTVSFAANVKGDLRLKKGLKKCNLCKRMIVAKDIRRHLKTSHVQDGVKCDYCCCTFLLNRGRLRHQTVVHGISVRNAAAAATNYKQTIVARAKKQLVVTSSKSKLLSKIKNGRKIYPCTICKVEFRSGQRLLDHMNSHTGARPYKCNKCGFRFSHRSNLARHLRKAHTKNDTIFCRICNCSFSHGTLLARHNKSLHPTKLKIKKLKQEQSSEDEMKVEDIGASSESKGNTDVKNSNGDTVPNTKCPPANSLGFYECDICHKELTTQQTWRGHMLIHKNLKPFKCEYCDASFRLHSTRRNHIKTCHTGGKFKCKRCSCSFNSIRTLDVHKRRSHMIKKNESVPKPSAETKANNDKDESQKKDELSRKAEKIRGFKCNLCGTIVKLLEDFEDHKKMHNGNDRTQCNLCLKKFASSINVKIHKDRAHGDAAVHIHRCAFCCCRYKGTQALFSHLVKAHDMRRDDWDFGNKCLKSEARKRIQLKMCPFDTIEVVDRKPEFSKASPSGKPNDRHSDKVESATKESPKSFHECDICHQRFKLHRSIFNHKKKAHNHGRYVCGFCPCRYQKMTWLKKHQLKVHGSLKQPPVKPIAEMKQSLRPNAKIECNICKFKFVSLKSLAAHKLKSHLHTGKFKCDQCPCKFKAQHGLAVHRSMHHGIISKTRLKALSKLNSNTSISEDEPNSENHNDGDADGNKMVRGSNDIEGEDESSTNENITTDVARKFECDICKMKFTHKSSVGTHKKKAHFHSGKYACLQCPCKFLTSGGLINHRKAHHGLVGSRIRRDRRLNKIVMRGRKPHSNLKPSESVSEEKDTKNNENIGLNAIEDSSKVECDHCHLMILRSQLRRHIMTSHGGGDYSCPDCSCVFTMRQGLTRHRVFYHKFKGKKNNSKNFAISMQSRGATKTNPKRKVNLSFLRIRGFPSSKKSPSKSCSSKSLVKEPTSSSTKSASSTQENSSGVEFFPNNIPRSSSASTNYKLKCEICGTRFAHKTYLTRHQERAHIEGGVPCDICPCTFINGIALAAHKRTYHTSGLGASASKSLKKFGKIKKRAALFVKRNKKFSAVSKSNDSKTEAVKNATLPEYSKTRNKTLSKSEESTSPGSLQKSSTFENNPVGSSPQKSLQEFQCSFCLKTFGSLQKLRVHILSHTKPEICSKCGMRFRMKEEVVKHIKQAHDLSLPYECDVCTCRFATRKGLYSHHTLLHKKQPTSYGDIVIEQDEDVTVDSEPFIDVGSTYAQQNGDSFCDESEPIVQGILETNYNPHEDYEESQEEVQEMSTDMPENEMEFYEDSEPIVQGHMEYGEIEGTGFNSEPSQPASTSKGKKQFSPKSRPIKCSTCGMTCLGPEKFRLHMLSHQQSEEDNGTNELIGSNIDENRVQKCQKCGNEFQSRQELAQHMQVEHDESGLYRCAYCPCTMKNETNLRYHFMKYHS